jgi:hypothetical protein
VENEAYEARVDNAIKGVERDGCEMKMKHEMGLGYKKGERGRTRLAKS